jgi:hypothetical protein
MQVQAVLIRAFLAIHEELAEFGGTERRTQHPIHQHELVNRLTN